MENENHPKFLGLVGKTISKVHLSNSHGHIVMIEFTEENTLIYNGLDRKDNNIGYSLDNCIPACHTCNRMKMDLSYDEFMTKIKQTYEIHYAQQ